MNIGKALKEYWKKIQRTSKEPLNFWTLLSNLRTKFKRTYKGIFEELGKSFEGIFKVLGQVLQSSWKKISKYIGKNFEFLFERFEQTIFFSKMQNFLDPQGVRPHTHFPPGCEIIPTLLRASVITTVKLTFK
jgi:hypothetical protein